jgi:hypothetical protein
MRHKNKLIATLILLLASGCSDFFMICSLNPYYLDHNTLCIPLVEGDWMAIPLFRKSDSGKNETKDVWEKADTASIWRIERVILKQTVKTSGGKDSTVLSPQNSYSVKLIGSFPDSASYEFRMVLFQVKKEIYGDFYPTNHAGLAESRFATESHFPVHTLARIDTDGERFEVSWLGAEYMKEMIEKKRVRVSYRWVGSAKRLLLTGSSEQLTGMLERYADETRFIDWKNQPAMLKLNKVKK